VIKELKGLYAKAVFCAIDFETTGLDCEAERIVEMACVRFDASGALGEFQTLCNPGIRIPARVTSIHGISDDMVAHEKSEGDALASFLREIDGCVIVAHNAPFDVGFLRAACARHRLAFPSFSTFDTRLLAKAAFPHKSSYALQALAKDFSLDPGDAHRALSDARTCVALFRLCATRLVPLPQAKKTAKA
jgi:DNA polymerase-3 subunit epsilon